MTKIGGGYTSDIFLYDGKIVKLLKGFMSDTEANSEADKQKLAHSYGVPVPDVYEVTKVDGRYAIVMEYVPGKTLGNMIFENQPKAYNYLSLSVDTQLNIQSKNAEGFETMIEVLQRKFQYRSALNDQQRAELLNRALAIQHEKRLCHGDCHVLNMIINSENNIIVIDWVDASAGDIRADACRSYLLYLLHAPELADLYLRLYCEKSGISQEDIFIWKPIMAGAILSENSAINKAGYLLEMVSQFCS